MFVIYELPDKRYLSQITYSKNINNGHDKVICMTELSRQQMIMHIKGILRL